jgi:hypothetical protein
MRPCAPSHALGEQLAQEQLEVVLRVGVRGIGLHRRLEVGLAAFHRGGAARPVLPRVEEGEDAEEVVRVGGRAGAGRAREVRQGLLERSALRRLREAVVEAVPLGDDGDEAPLGTAERERTVEIE